MNKTRNQLSEREKELVQQLMAECETTGDIQEKLKKKTGIMCADEPNFILY